MPHPTPFRFRGLLFTLLLAMPGAAMAEQAVFDLSIAGLTAGRVTLASTRSGDGYDAAARIEPTGLVSAFTRYGFDGRASGSVGAGGTVVPRRFEAVSTSPRAERRTEIDWKGGTPVRVSVDPPRETAPEPAQQGGTLDPVSATFALLGAAEPGRVCNTSVEIFDGSRRSRLQLAAPKQVQDGYVCAGSYTRLEGEAHSATDQRTFPFQVTFQPNGRGQVELLRIETPTRFGTAVVERRG